MPVPYAKLDNPQSLNLYSYVLNNPLSKTDPDGHCIEDFCIVEGAAVVAFAESPAGQRVEEEAEEVAERLLGQSYLHLLGEEQVRTCPFYSCETLADGLLLTASERPDSLEMTESDSVLLALEKCLGVDVFATDDYPSVPCRVPNFNLSETVNAAISV